MKPSNMRVVVTLLTIASLCMTGIAAGVPALPTTAVVKEQTTRPASQPTDKVRITKHTIEKKLPEAAIKVDYPQVGGLKRKSVERDINLLLKKKAETFVNNAVKEAKTSQPSTPSGNPYEYIGKYDVTYNQNGVLSILEETYAYTGGAHGMSYREGLTFRLSDGKLLTLDELLRANPNYRTIVDPAIKGKLEQTEGYFSNFKTIGPNPSYYVKDKGVYIFFQLYEYLPYVFGFPEYYFPFTQLLPPGANPFEWS
ncbi:DUF3298/DUF4163 domain-containing protein [Paenibacillus oralis]|uniref:DUF3298/DUF4163 domain-containing protein n=1 Tax=Paenibacillus oralis TaxID=2490856 RepID=A0A3P3TZU0_9BACL|nr:DUF3298 and DUF4163 domain-containing protein [Paenibacillus oralis]RRJ63206.1 DUF3298/DUF4163 domain-containing protein [Paenibacillus oralis]